LIAGWLGIPAGIVIAVMIILRKRGMALRARRQQARQASRTAPGHGPRIPELWGGALLSAERVKGGVE
jgi:hypothetical protein